VSPHCVDVFSKTQANPYVKHKFELAQISQLVSSQKTSQVNSRLSSFKWVWVCQLLQTA